MKILIWFLCLLAAAVLSAAAAAMGIRLGAIPVFVIYFCSFYSAKKLSKKWEETKIKKNNDDNS